MPAMPTNGHGETSARSVTTATTAPHRGQSFHFGSSSHPRCARRPSRARARPPRASRRAPAGRSAGRRPPVLDPVVLHAEPEVAHAVGVTRWASSRPGGAAPSTRSAASPWSGSPLMAASQQVRQRLGVPALPLGQRPRACCAQSSAGFGDESGQLDSARCSCARIRKAQARSVRRPVLPGSAPVPARSPRAPPAARGRPGGRTPCGRRPPRPRPGIPRPNDATAGLDLGFSLITTFQTRLPVCGFPAARRDALEQHVVGPLPRMKRNRSALPYS